MPQELTDKVEWLGHASFRLRGSVIVYIDPWKIEGNPRDGDLVFITHSHYDHYSQEDIAKVIKSDGQLIAPDSCKGTILETNVLWMKPGERTSVLGIDVETLPAYNVDKDFHPRSNGWLGYIITLDGTRIYHCGDTDVIDEMNGLCVDIALLAVSGTYVMDAEQAVEAARMIGPKVAIPMHWGVIVGGRDDAQRFKVSAPCPVILKDPVP